MATVQEFIHAADEFMLAPKRIVGVTTSQRWREDSRYRGEGAQSLKLPIEINGEQRINHGLYLGAFPNAEELKFTISLIFQWGIFRLDFNEEKAHLNPPDTDLDGIQLWISGPHYHAWNDNKQLINSVTEAFKLPVARPLPSNIRQFDAAFRWFCSETNIELTNHEILLPHRESLFP